MEKIKEKKRKKELTERELLILKYICAGYSDKEISEFIDVSYNNLRRIIDVIYTKADVSNRVTLIAWGFRNNYLK